MDESRMTFPSNWNNNDKIDREIGPRKKNTAPEKSQYAMNTDNNIHPPRCNICHKMQQSSQL